MKSSDTNLMFVGSGDGDPVHEISNVVFINTSFSRTKKINGKYYIDTIFMADGYTDIKQVKNAKIIPGYSLEQSSQIRADKVALYSKLTVKKIIMVSNFSLEKLKIGLADLGITYENLLIISIRRLYLM